MQKQDQVRLKRIKLTPELESKTTGIINATCRLKNSLARRGVDFITSGSQEQHLQEKRVDVGIAVNVDKDSGFARSGNLGSL